MIELKRLQPVRQIEAAELYLAMHQPEILSELQRMTSAPPT